jgi:hypothetical protein
MTSIKTQRPIPFPLSFDFSGFIFLIQLPAVIYYAQENPPEEEQDEADERFPNPWLEPDELDEKVDKSLSLFFPPQVGQGMCS